MILRDLEIVRKSRNILQRRGIIFADGEKHDEARTVASRFFSKHGLKSLTKSANGGAAASSSASVASIREKLSRKDKI